MEDLVLGVTLTVTVLTTPVPLVGERRQRLVLYNAQKVDDVAWTTRRKEDEGRAEATKGEDLQPEAAACEDEKQNFLLPPPGAAASMCICFSVLSSALRCIERTSAGCFWFCVAEPD